MDFIFQCAAFLLGWVCGVHVAPYLRRKYKIVQDRRSIELGKKIMTPKTTLPGHLTKGDRVLVVKGGRSGSRGIVNKVTNSYGQDWFHVRIDEDPEIFYYNRKSLHKLNDL